MEYRSSLEQGFGDEPFGDTALLDPCRFVREAELALVLGNRKEAVALVALAYLAFDLLAADCDKIRALDMALPERSN